ncbi:MAG TPA: hypothetical protein VGH19_13025 [Verrucomicrobiae bacterium]
MENQNRRTALKTVALAAGALLSTEALAIEAKPNYPRSTPGRWLFSGKPCAIFQQGPILLIVNETGTLATGQFTNQDTFKIIKGDGWGIGMTGQLIEKGKRIKWSDGAYWIQA